MCIRDRLYGVYAGRMRKSHGGQPRYGSDEMCIRDRVYIDCRCIVPSCSSNALNIELVVPNRHVADWTGFIPLIGVVGQENGCHGHVKEFVSFDYNFVSCST